MSEGNYQGPGVYEHYKGGHYRVLGLAMDELSKEHDATSVFVIYEPLTAGSVLEGTEYKFWARRLSNFNSQVDIPQGTTVHAGSGGDIVPRFRYIDDGTELGKLPIGRILQAEAKDELEAIKRRITDADMDPALRVALLNLVRITTGIKDALLIHLGEI